MSWLDSVLATPVVGLQLKPIFKTALAYSSLLGDFMDGLLAEKRHVNLAQAAAAVFQVSLPRDGHILRLDVNNAVAEYQYQYQGEVAPGEMPVVKDVAVKAYSDVAVELVSLLARASESLASHGNPLIVSRFGLVARVSMAENSVPPGVLTMRDSLTDQWNHPVAKMDSMVLVNLAEDDARLDRCHHKLTFDDTAMAGQLGLMLDWQRMFKSPVEIRGGKAEEILTAHMNDALAYFERVADGGYNDEQ